MIALGYIFKIKKKLVTLFSPTINRFIFNISGAKVSKDARIVGSVYLNLERKAELNIGSLFSMTSGFGLNPLCRNLKSMIYVKRHACVNIGDNVGISSSCIWSNISITIGNNVNIGGDCIIMDSDIHSLNYLERQNHDIDLANGVSEPIVIEDDAFIGTRSIVLKGVTIGARSIIAAGSVVVKSIPADCIAGGNPCKVIKYINNNDR